jgi:hypothetical protein
METLRTFCSDLKIDLKQTKDDLEIPDAQLMYWTLVIGDRLRMQHIVKRRSGAYLTRFVLAVQADSTFTERRYVVLPRTIYDIDLDGGVESLCYYKANKDRPEFSLVTFFRTSPSNMRSMNMSTYKKASLTHPYFWREGDRLYLDGVHNSLPNVEAHLYTNLPDINEVDPDAPFDFPKELLYPLKRAILDMGRFALSLPGEHLVNDGTNRPAKEVIGQPGKTVSVNDPLVNSGE